MVSGSQTLMARTTPRRYARAISLSTDKRLASAGLGRHRLARTRLAYAMLVSALFVAAACAPRARQMPAEADLVLVGGRVWTGDAKRPRATAIAIRNGSIVRVGNDVEVLALAAPDARRIDLAGRCVVPGFVDAHVHFSTGGLELLGPKLHGTRSMEEFGRRLQEAARTLPEGTWIRGGGWDHERWPSHPWPDHKIVDRFVPKHPVFVLRTDGHVGFANGMALRLAGIDASTKNPSDGVIVRDESGRAIGTLKDSAMQLVTRVIPAASKALRLRALRGAVALARERGVTAVHDMGTVDDWELWNELERRGELSVRVRFFFPISARARAIAEHRRRRSATTRAWLRVAGVKAFADGSLGASTAWMFEPFADDPSNCGLCDASFADREAFLDAVLEVDRAGLQVAVHAIGDRANKELLDLFAAVEYGSGQRDRRMRIEHAQHLRPADLPRFAKHGVIPSMQPYHAVDDGRWAERKLGTVRSRTTYAFASLLRHDAKLAFGSDWFVAPLDPLLGLHAAVTRATIDGKRPGGWIPEQRIGLEAALRCSTHGGAYAAFDEDELGRIAAGYRADLVVIDRDPFSIDAARLDELRVAMTIVDGRIVWEAPKRRASVGPHRSSGR